MRNTKFKKIKEFLLLHKWIILLSIIFFICYLIIFSKFKYLPGPLYGGDIYYHFGEVNHLSEGGNFFKSSHYLNEYPHYPRLSHLLIVFFSKIFFLDTLTANIYFSIVANLISGLLFYIIGRKLFGTPYDLLLSLFGFLYVSIGSTPSSLATKIFIPLIFLCFLYIEKRKWIIGIIFGLISIAHITTFLIYNLMLFLYLLFKLLSNKSFKDKIKDVLNITPIVMIANTISLIYWFPILFIYKIKTINSWQEYVYKGLSGVIPTFIDNIKSLFSFENFSFLIPFLIIVGILILIKRHNYKNEQIIILLFLTFIIGYLHPLITKPLINTSFGFYGFSQIIYFLKSLIIIYGAYSLSEYIKNFKKYKNIILIVVFLQVIVFLSIININMSNEQGIKMATEGNIIMDKQLDIARYIKTNTKVDDVIITPHGETSFSINAITGRKIVFMRRTHASPFVDANKREADAAIILYGNNSRTIEKLIHEYNVKYLFIDLYSLQEIQRCLEVWDQLDKPEYQELSYSCLRTSIDYEEYLRNNGIETKKVYARQDIASNDAPKTYLLAIKPNIININTKNLTLLKQENINGQSIAYFYKIN